MNRLEDRGEPGTGREVRPPGRRGTGDRAAGTGSIQPPARVAAAVRVSPERGLDRVVQNGCGQVEDCLCRLLLLILELLLTQWLRTGPTHKDAPGRGLARNRRATRVKRNGTSG